VRGRRRGRGTGQSAASDGSCALDTSVDDQVQASVTPLRRESRRRCCCGKSRCTPDFPGTGAQSRTPHRVVTEWCRPQVSHPGRACPFASHEATALRQLAVGDARDALAALIQRERDSIDRAANQPRRPRVTGLVAHHGGSVCEVSPSPRQPTCRGCATEHHAMGGWRPSLSPLSTHFFRRAPPPAS
jgi:hypothetical protein